MTASGNKRKNEMPREQIGKIEKHIKIGPLNVMKIYCVLFTAALLYAYQVYESILVIAGIVVILALFIRFPGTEKAGINGMFACARNIYVVTLITAVLIVIFI